MAAEAITAQVLRQSGQCGSIVQAVTQQPASAAPVIPLSLCAGCGAAVASSLSRCGVCGVDYSTATTGGTLGETERWARLECHFRCTSCGTQSPINHLDLDGAVDCAHCGLEQAFDVGSWTRILSTAHDVVDLAATDPAVRNADHSSKLRLENPYHHVGAAMADRTWSEPTAVAGRSELTLRVSPGHPLCEACKLPFHVDARQPGSLRLSCTGCGATQTHCMPPTTATFCAAVGAVAASAHRTDMATANSQLTSTGAASVTCPQCGAPLPTDTHSTTAVCGYCRTQALISSKLWFRLGVSEPRTEPIWLLFRGRSSRRGQLESKDANVDPFEEELKARARAALGGADPAPPAPLPSAGLPPGGPPPVGAAPPAQAPPPGLGAGFASPVGQPPRASGSGGAAVAIALVAVMLCLGAAAVVFFALM